MVTIEYRQIVKFESLPNFSLTHNINISDVFSRHTIVYSAGHASVKNQQDLDTTS